eukprot:COSAG06_NODE_1118_length_10635_cov_5.052946_5_plen_74_part_00
MADQLKGNLNKKTSFSLGRRADHCLQGLSAQLQLQWVQRYQAYGQQVRAEHSAVAYYIDTDRSYLGKAVQYHA